MLRLPLPFSLIILCFFVLNKVKAQQCRLTAQSRAIVSTSGNHSGTTTRSAAPSSSASTSTSTSTSSAAAPTTTPQMNSFAYGSQPIRGVNLGGWFVLEPWITPSIFQNTGNTAIVDEYTFGQMQDYNTALQVLNNHWNTWITESDFIDIQAAGLSHVRIPIGYWSIPVDNTSVAPYITGAWPYIQRAISWANLHSIHVILDLHGAPGSQNGFDNSGQRTNAPVWASNPANVARTLDILTYIATNLGPQVDVIELLNEPAGFDGDTGAVVRQFWSDGYNAVRAAIGGGVKIMIGDAFLGVSDWQNFMTYPNAQGVLMDYHEYQIFSNNELSRSLDEHIAFACNISQNLTSFASSNLYTVLGEWSNAPTDCAQWLNGRGVGARWDGTWWTDNQVHGSCNGWTGNSSGFSDDYKVFLRKYWEVQVDVGEGVEGWVFWTWKAENADEWSYQKGLDGGWIPQDPTERMYPGLCG